MQLGLGTSASRGPNRNTVKWATFGTFGKWNSLLVGLGLGLSDLSLCWPTNKSSCPYQQLGEVRSTDTYSQPRSTTSSSLCYSTPTSQYFELVASFGTLPLLKPTPDPNTAPPPDPRRMPTPWSQVARASQPSYTAPVETPQGQYFSYPTVDPNANPGYYVPPIHTSPHNGFPGLQTLSPMFHNTHNVRTGTFFPDQPPDYV